MKHLAIAGFFGLIVMSACSSNGKNTSAESDTPNDTLKTFVYEGNPLIRDKDTVCNGSVNGRPLDTARRTHRDGIK